MCISLSLEAYLSLGVCCNLYTFIDASYFSGNGRRYWYEWYSRHEGRPRFTRARWSSRSFWAYRSTWQNWCTRKNCKKFEKYVCPILLSSFLVFTKYILDWTEYVSVRNMPLLFVFCRVQKVQRETLVHLVQLEDQEILDCL